MQFDCLPYARRSRWIVARDVAVAVSLILLAVTLYLALILCVVLYLSSSVAKAGEVAPLTAAERAWLQSWIPASCCVTNDCCFPIKQSAVQPLGNDRWRVVATGQVRSRTDWSRDGQFWRCACDYDGARWIVHEKANTRCIFPPMNFSFSRRP